MMWNRNPEIYDLWAEIRAYWRIQDYFESKWKAIDSLKDNPGFCKVAWEGEPKITLYPYRLVLK